MPEFAQRDVEYIKPDALHLIDRTPEVGGGHQAPCYRYNLRFVNTKHFTSIFVPGAMIVESLYPFSGSSASSTESF